MTTTNTTITIFIASLRALRAHQWTKNVLLFAALVFSVNFTERAHIINALTGFAAFCLLSSSGYILNDLLDREADRKHPKKSKRPIASGALPPAIAVLEFFVLIGAGSALSWSLSPLFSVLAFCYLATTLSYSFYFKHFVILDVMFIAAGFVWRAVAGAAAISVTISPWFFLCTAFLALFLGFTKRRGELTDLGDAAGTRKNLQEYNLALLDHYQGIVVGNVVLAYALYAALPANMGGGPTPLMTLTVPFVLYGLFRFLYLVEVKGEGAAPDETLLRDRPIQITVVSYGLLTMAILYGNANGLLSNFMG